MTKSQKEKKRTQIIVAIIGALSVIIAAVLGPLVVKLLEGSSPTESLIAVRVADANTRDALTNAHILLLVSGNSLSDFTNTTGVATLTINTDSSNALLIVEHDKYEIFEQKIPLPGDDVITVLLKERKDDSGSIIVRVEDDNAIPISGAKVVLLVEGEIHDQSTDSNGIAKFTLNFPEGKIEVQVNVGTRNFEGESKTVTLLPNRVLNVHLNPTTNEMNVADLEALQSVPSEGSTTSSITFGQIISSTISLPAETDVYTFAANTDDVLFIRIARLSGDLCAHIRLFDPDRVQIAGQGSYPGCRSIEVNETLPLNGQYTILMGDEFNKNTGGYSLHIQRLP